jgi:hypothetical protein
VKKPVIYQQPIFYRGPNEAYYSGDPSRRCGFIRGSVSAGTRHLTALMMYYILCLLMVLVSLNGTEALLSKTLKVLRLRLYNTQGCDPSSFTGTAWYASTDNSCLCYNPDVNWSSDKTCNSAQGLVVGDTFRAWFTLGNRCDVYYESSIISGTLHICVPPLTSFNLSTSYLLADVAHIQEPLYIWQLALIALGCLIVACLVIGVAFRLYKRHMRKRGLLVSGEDV